MLLLMFFCYFFVPFIICLFLVRRNSNRYDIRDSELTNIRRNSVPESDSVAICNYEPSSGQGQQKEERAVAFQPNISKSASDPVMLSHDFEPPESFDGDSGPPKLAELTSDSPKLKGPSPSEDWFQMDLFKKQDQLKEQIMRSDELKEQGRLKKLDKLEVWDRLKMSAREEELTRDQLNEEKLEREREALVSEWDREQERKMMRGRGLELLLQNKIKNKKPLEVKMRRAPEQELLVPKMIKNEKLDRPKKERLKGSEQEIDIVMEEEMQQGDAGKSSYDVLSPFIFRTPFPGLEFQKPELVCIGPYHRDVDYPLNKYKHSFMEKFIRRTGNYAERDLRFYIGEIIALENQARVCYSDDLGMSSCEFVKTMLLDGCFIIELLRQFGGRGTSEDDLFPEDPINIIMPWQIPILVQDLLLLENQIPFFVLLKLFALSTNIEGKPEVSVTTMALKFFDLAFPLSSDFISENRLLKPNHLLDLFVMTLLPSNPRNISDLDHPSNRGSKRAEDEKEYQSPVPLPKGVAEIQLAGIKFMPSRARSFLDFNFKGGVLELPLVTINNLFSTILVNSMALETCSPYYNNKPKPFTRYIYFMSSLIKEASDVKFLCLKGIISRFSSNDKRVMDLFTLLGRYAVPDASDYDLWDTIREMRCYNWKTTTPKQQFPTDFFLLFMLVAVTLSLFCSSYLEDLGTRYAAPDVFLLLLVPFIICLFLVRRNSNRYDIRDSELTNIGRNSVPESDSVAICNYEPSSGQGQQKDERAVALQPKISKSASDPEMLIHDFEPKISKSASDPEMLIHDFEPPESFVGDSGPPKLPERRPPELLLPLSPMASNSDFETLIPESWRPKLAELTSDSPKLTKRRPSKLSLPSPPKLPSPPSSPQLWQSSPPKGPSPSEDWLRMDLYKKEMGQLKEELDQLMEKRDQLKEQRMMPNKLKEQDWLKKLDMRDRLKKLVQKMIKKEKLDRPKKERLKGPEQRVKGAGKPVKGKSSGKGKGKGIELTMNHDSVVLRTGNR